MFKGPQVWIVCFDVFQGHPVHWCVLKALRVLLLLVLFMFLFFLLVFILLIQESCTFMDYNVIYALCKDQSRVPDIFLTLNS